MWEADGKGTKVETGGVARRQWSVWGMAVAGDGCTQDGEMRWRQYEAEFSRLVHWFTGK